MHLKKILKFGTSLAIITAPLLSYALPDLIINNNTNESSTVRVTSGIIKPCSSIHSGGVTQPHETNHHVSWTLVTALCATSSGNQCTADIFPTNNCGSHENAIGQATLDLKTGNITVNQIYNRKYSITASGSTVNINYAG